MLAPCSYPGPQGTQVFVRALARALGAAGHELHLVAYAAARPWPAQGAEPYCLHRAEHRPVAARSGPQWRKLAADVALWRRALAVGRRHRVDLVHAHNAEGLVLGLALRRALGAPLVYHSHNAMAEELPSYASAARRRPWRALGLLFDAALPRRADAVLCFDGASAARQRRRGVAAGRLRVVAPGHPRLPVDGAVDAALVAAAGAALGAPLCVVYSGNADGYQALPLLYAAMARLRRWQPRARLLLATHGPVRRFAPPTAAAAHVVRVPNFATMAALLRLAHVGVSPRRAQCGVPIKVLNYQAAGLPVVTCSRAAAAWAAPAALWVAAPTPAALAGALLRAWRQRRRPPAPPPVAAACGAYAVTYAAVLAAWRGRPAAQAGAPHGLAAAGGSGSP